MSTEATETNSISTADPEKGQQIDSKRESQQQQGRDERAEPSTKDSLLGLDKVGELASQLWVDSIRSSTSAWVGAAR